MKDQVIATIPICLVLWFTYLHLPLSIITYYPWGLGFRVIGSSTYPCGNKRGLLGRVLREQPQNGLAVPSIVGIPFSFNEALAFSLVEVRKNPERNPLKQP